MSLTVLGIAAADRRLYVLRGDGAVFVLFRRGDSLLDGTKVHEPFWAAVPAVPGTEAAREQQG